GEIQLQVSSLHRVTAWPPLAGGWPPLHLTRAPPEHKKEQGRAHGPPIPSLPSPLQEISVMQPTSPLDVCSRPAGEVQPPPAPATHRRGFSEDGIQVSRSSPTARQWRSDPPGLCDD